MKNIINKVLLISLLLLPALCFSQESTIKRSNNKVSLNGKAYYIHIVRKGETLFAIGNSYKIPVDSIKKDNLHISDELKINQYLKIRLCKSEKVKQSNSYLSHKVIKGDTPFNIARRYKVTINDIYKENTGSKLGIKLGEILKIPIEPTEITYKSDSINTDTANTGFIVHKTLKKETKYGIANKYSITVEDIEKYNPELTERQLNIGEYIKIPIKSKDILGNQDIHYHVVKKKETVYGITKMYSISKKEFYNSNSQTKKRELQIGELVMIPKTKLTDSIFSKKYIKDSLESIEVKIPVNNTIDTYIAMPCSEPVIDTVNTYKVAIFLPLYLNINDTLGKFIDKMIVDEDGIAVLKTMPRTGIIKDQIYGRSRMFLEFYEGALLALNDLKKQGMSFEIHVFDTQNDSTYTVKLLAKNNLHDFNLFIGPFYSEILNIVNDYAWEHQINIVSPLSLKNSFIEHNPYAFQVSPPFEVQMLHASEYLNKFDTKNYIVIHDGKNLNQEYIAVFKQQLYAQINDSNFNQVKYNEVQYYDTRDKVLKDVFSRGIENIVIVPSNNQAFVSDVMGKLNGYSYNYNITTFGQPRWITFDNIELESFHNTNTHIFSNSFIDYTKPEVVKFVYTYRKLYDYEPNKYSFHGYDITKYFCTALNKYGHEFRKCIHMNETSLLQTNFNFVPYTDQGGYQNTAIYILEYTKENKLIKAAQFP